MSNVAYKYYVIASMTSWKKRITNVPKVIESIFSGEIVPNELIVNLSEEEFPNKESDLPKELLNIQYPVTINWVYKNTYAFKKLIPTLQKYWKYKDRYIWCIDDDFIYNTDCLLILLKNLEKYSENSMISAKWDSGACRLFRIGDFDEFIYTGLNDAIINNRIDDCWYSENLYAKGIKQYSCYEYLNNSYGTPINSVFPMSDYYGSKIEFAHKLVHDIVTSHYKYNKVKTQVITFGYNNNIVTEHLIKSLLKLGYDLQKDLNFTIADNSNIDDGDIYIAKKYNVNYIDGRNNRLNFPIDNTNTWGSTSHQNMIQYCLDNISDDIDYVILMDCDIYVKQRFDDIIEKMYNNKYITSGVLLSDIWEERIHPCFQILDIKQMKNKNIKYEGKLEFGKCDTGSEFYSKVKDNALLLTDNPVKTQDINCDYFIHYSGLTHGYNNAAFNYNESYLNDTNYNDLTLITFNYNTPELVQVMLKSFFKQNSTFSGNIIIFDNSDISKFTSDMYNYDKLYIIDNTNQHYVNYSILDKYKKHSDKLSNYGSAKHSMCIDYVFRYHVKSEYMLIVDSDIIFKNSIYEMYNKVKKDSYIVGECGKYLNKDNTINLDNIDHTIRLFPVMFMVDTYIFTQNPTLKYFDPNRMVCLNDNFNYYDTGVSFYEDLIKENIYVSQIKINDYVNHLCGGSYYNKKAINTFIQNNIQYIN